jgi:hypothetical protein
MLTEEEKSVLTPKELFLLNNTTNIFIEKLTQSLARERIKNKREQKKSGIYLDALRKIYSLPDSDDRHISDYAEIAEDAISEAEKEL